MTETIAVTGATGQLGRLVIANLLESAPAARIIGIVREAARAKDLADRGVEIRTADYDNVASVTAALSGVEKLLLISSNAVGKRVAQHRNVVAAAKAVGVTFLAYTSILHADTNPMDLAAEHRDTEAAIRASGLPFVLLRNGWYTENYTGTAADSAERGVVIGASGAGRISAAARADYAAAAAAVLASSDGRAGTVHELAGDEPFTLADLAAEIARQSGKPVVYNDLTEADFKAMLLASGVPEVDAHLYADSHAKSASDALYDDSRRLSRLIGRPTTSLAQSVAAALPGHRKSHLKAHSAA